MPTIRFTNEKKEIQVPEGANLRREAIRAGVRGTRRVLITKGMENTSRMGLRERIRLRLSMAYIGNEKVMRLASRTRVNGDVEVETKPGMNLFGENFFS